MTSSNWIAVCSAIVAVCALVVSVCQIKATIRHNKLQTKPFVEVDIQCVLDQTKLSLENHGLGPAIITSIIATYKGGTYQINNAAGLDSLTDQIPQEVLDQLDINQNHLGPRAALHAGRSISVIDIATIDPQARDAANQFLDGLKLQVVYESVYGDKFVVEA